LTVSGWQHTVNARFQSFIARMNSAINFVEFENRVISATYRSLMIKAKVVLIDGARDAPLSDPVVTITSPLPTGTLRIRLPDTVKAGIYYLRALNAHGDRLARSTEFWVG
jgi:hypothetical protein